jgi:hypothetical protein
MTDRTISQPNVIATLKRIDKSSLQQWMEKNYRSMTAQMSRTKVAGWSDLVNDFIALGLTDGSGKPPSIQSARKTWKRVKDARAQIEMDRVSKRPANNRSAQKNDWRPEARPPNSPLRNATADASGAVRGGAGFFAEDNHIPPAPAPPSPQKKQATYEDLTPEQRAMIDGVCAGFHETVRKRSGF